MPSGAVVTTTGRRAEARSGGTQVPGICGQARSRNNADNADYCVYATPGEADTAGSAFLSNGPDVLLVVAVPDAGLRLRFEPDHGRATEGAVLSVPGAKAPQLGLIAIPRSALGGRVVVFRARTDYRLVSDHVGADACTRPGGGLWLCSRDLEFSPRGSAADRARRPNGTLI
jgi:hypothetical protein